MAKADKTVFFCKECGYESAKWLGQCPGCKEVGTFVEEPKGPKNKTIRRNVTSSMPVTINEVKADDEERISTGFSELDRVLGGGVVPGGLILVGGDPGIGKSTLLLQVCRNMSASGKKILYISGEESLKQIKLRANRMGEFSNNLSLLSETSLDNIEAVVTETKPDAVVIDSIQTIYREDISSAPGSVSQVRESTNTLMQIAKGLTIPIFIVGHVTKEGVVAGPRVLEHMVDTVLYFEGDRHATYRILRGVKNRFGSTNEIGVFEMSEEGLRQVLNPSEFMLEGRPTDASGSVVACLMEGTRPILVEVQALINHTAFGMPRRTAVGTDYNRVNLLMAVIEKRMGIQMGDYDAYVNVAGGMKVNEPAMDLALVMALISSYKNRAIDPATLVFGEVGLSGEVRAVSNVQQRVMEAKKLGFKHCILPAVSVKSLKDVEGIELVGVKNIKEAGENI
ncbi:DNA repair protein RadA [Eubacterium sp. AF36-5BH]|uniref:DNA repair protein RadA n=1 Tax=Eubacterium sp. AF36-5BH TaxID=2293108 RepID=UPI000E519D3E|nr:DNA repair protein RadA [Eubacterium sp. AF36-5BH]RGF52993.1 DNA repair protein RadA [Eubacterium sp. AF36-5BH]